MKFESQELIDLIKAEEVVAFPTETVFGIGIIYDSPNAFDKLVEIKKRKPDKPFTVMISDIFQIDKLAVLNQKAKRVIETFMPGEITILLQAKTDLPYHVTIGHTTIGIRMSSNKYLTEMIKRVQKPMLVTSLNLSSEPPILTYEDAVAQFKDKVAAIVEQEEVNSSKIPSTIVDCSKEDIALIRQGNIPYGIIKKVWEEEK